MVRVAVSIPSFSAYVFLLIYPNKIWLLTTYTDLYKYTDTHQFRPSDRIISFLRFSMKRMPLKLPNPRSSYDHIHTFLKTNLLAIT
jgi:hypothetical protein